MSVATMIAKAGQTLTHERQADVRGLSGARASGNWTTLASNVRCWLQPASGRLAERFAAQQLAVSHVVFTATELSVQGNDRLHIGSRYYLVRGEVDQAGLGRVYAYAVEELR